MEEVEERIKKLKEVDNMCRVNAERNRNFESVKYFQSLMFATERAESIIGDIIRSHMDEAKDINVPSNDELIGRKALKEKIENLRMIITGMRNGKTMTAKALEEYKKSILRIIDEQQTENNDNWIPVEERLPEHDYETVLCVDAVDYYFVAVYTKKDGFRTEDFGADYENIIAVLCVDAVDYYFVAVYTKKDGFRTEDFGADYENIIAWQPLPEPYRLKEQNDGE